MSKEIRLSNGPDTFEFTKDMEWTNVFGEGGDDRLVFATGGGNASGGPGNDTIENRLNASQWYEVSYWDSPNAVNINLALGSAQDGWGGTDTLITISRVAFGGKDGDSATGSDRDERFSISGFGGQKGTLQIDGAGGVDTVHNWQHNLKDFKVTTTVDGQVVTLEKNGYLARLTNIEALAFSGNGSLEETYRIADLIATSQLGEQTLIAANATGWAAKAGRPASLTFSFMNEAPVYGGLEPGSRFASPKADYQQAVRSILGELGTQTGLRFEEVSDSNSHYGQLRFGASQQSQTKGYAFIPGQANKELAGDVWLDTETTQLLKPGQEGWAALLHEIGHALGLEHPVASPNSDASRPALLSKWNHQGYTVMSETTSPSGLWPQWFGPLDIQALQHLYGENSETLKAGAQFVLLSDTMGATLAPAILPANQGHVFDASKLSVGALIDLRAGQASSVGLNTTGIAFGNLVLGFDSPVQKAVGSNHDDVFIGNNLDNFFWVGLGNDHVEGAGGLNTVVLPGSVSQYSISAAVKPNAFFIDALDGISGSKQVSNVQTLRFDDAQVSLPSMAKVSATPLAPPLPGAGLQTLNLLEFAALPTPSWASNPNVPNGPGADLSQARFSAASMITVAFGADSIKPFLDIGMSFYSNGMRHAEVAKLIADNQIIESLLGSPENGAWINHVYKNVVGTPPGPDVQADFVQLLSSNQFSRAGLLELAAGLTPFVEQQASLVGFSLIQ